jgi:hypothetical protein
VRTKHEAARAREPERYEPPQAISLNQVPAGQSRCHDGSAVVVCTSGSGGHGVGYREHGFGGVCVTGKSASDGCYAGSGV